jgi:hypothetical protein
VQYSFDQIAKTQRKKKVKVLFTVKSKEAQTPRVKPKVNAKAIHFISVC